MLSTGLPTRQPQVKVRHKHILQPFKAWS
jgi:hypothetical protein